MKRTLQRTKRRIAVAFMIIFAIVLPFSSCAGITPGTKETTVLIASDLHLYSENLLGPNNKVYMKENFSTDGRIQEYDYELVRALVDEVNGKKPVFFVLTGDLSFNGERDSHLELTKLLGEIEETEVLVIPGNHDIYSLNCFSAKEDEALPIDGIDGEAFREISSEFGYTGAYSYDDNSLSYI